MALLGCWRAARHARRRPAFPGTAVKLFWMTDQRREPPPRRPVGDFARSPGTDRFSRKSPTPPRDATPPDFSLQPRERRRPSPIILAVATATILAVTALVIGLVALLTEPSAPAPSNTSGQSTATADKALCQAIGPLMKENDDRSNAFLATGEPGTPKRDAALQKFVTDTQEWARRTQQTLDAHSNPSRLITRALQRYVDDMQLFVASVRPGPGTQYDEAAWTDSIVAYGGPLTICQQLGVNW